MRRPSESDDMMVPVNISPTNGLKTTSRNSTDACCDALPWCRRGSPTSSTSYSAMQSPMSGTT